jgi:type I restriction enzyme S subunit
MQGRYPYFGPTGILDWLNEYRVDGEFALIGEDGDHFLKFKSQDMTVRYSGKANVNNHAHIIKRSKSCTPGWFYYYFLHRDITAWLSRQGAKRYKLKKADLEKLPLVLPPLPEQYSIVAALDKWTNAIEVCSQLIESSIQQKKALGQQLLTGKRRLPGFFSSKEIVHTSVGALPKDWDGVSIGKVATEVSVRNVNDEGLPVLACSKHVGIVNSLEYFKKKVYSDDLTNYKVVRRGQFGFPSNHIEEGSIGLQNICDAGVVSPIYTVFEIDESRVDAGFLFKVLKTDHYRQRFAAATNASVDRRGSLRWSGFKAIRIPLPSLKEQQAISAVIDHAAQLEEGYRQQREKLELEKRALMQQLLTGKRRVKLIPERTTLAKEHAS